MHGAVPGVVDGVADGFSPQHANWGHLRLIGPSHDGKFITTELEFEPRSMADPAQLAEIRDLVEHTLETKGVLARIRVRRAAETLPRAGMRLTATLAIRDRTSTRAPGATESGRVHHHRR